MRREVGHLGVTATPRPMCSSSLELVYEEEWVRKTVGHLSRNSQAPTAAVSETTRHVIFEEEPRP